MNSHANLFSLAGKTALVTGCRRGIGKAMAEALAEAGADIIGVSQSLEESNSEVGVAIEKLGRRFSAYSCDMSDRSAIDRFLQTMLDKHGVPNILVNNAGTIRRAQTESHSDEDWDHVLAVNLNAPFRIARELGKSMLQRGHGKIIFTASLLTFQGGIRVPSYAASKGALGQLTKALANEWAGRGIHVNAIAPGYIATDNTSALQQDPERSRQILERIPAGRWGTPDDLRGPTVFLASDASNYIHGEILTVDGGWMAR